MNVNDVLSLVNAGFTKAEIMQMFPQDTNTPAAPADQPAAAPDPAPVVSPENTQPADPPAAPAAPAAGEIGMPQLFGQLRELTQAIQAQNRAYAEQGTDIIEPYAAGVNTLRGLVNIPNKEETNNGRS